MYMSLFSKPTDKDLETYPNVLLTSPLEWEPSLLNYTCPHSDGDPVWAPDPSDHDKHCP